MRLHKFPFFSAQVKWNVWALEVQYMHANKNENLDEDYALIKKVQYCYWTEYILLYINIVVVDALEHARFIVYSLESNSGSARARLRRLTSILFSRGKYFLFCQWFVASLIVYIKEIGYTYWKKPHLKLITAYI